jgi:hypothetical protein
MPTLDVCKSNAAQQVSSLYKWRLSYFIQWLNCMNINIFFHVKIGNNLLFFLITFRSTNSQNPNNAMLGIVKNVTVSGTWERGGG